MSDLRSAGPCAVSSWSREPRALMRRDERVDVHCPTTVTTPLDHLAVGQAVGGGAPLDDARRRRARGGGRAPVRLASRAADDPAVPRRSRTPPLHRRRRRDPGRVRLRGRDDRIRTRAPRCSCTSSRSTRPARRRGIGRALVVALRDRAAELGCHGMWVLTDDDNEAALRTYASAGATGGRSTSCSSGSRSEDLRSRGTRRRLSSYATGSSRPRRSCSTSRRQASRRECSQRSSTCSSRSGSRSSASC